MGKWYLDSSRNAFWNPGSLCGTETLLYVRGAPICVSCADKGLERGEQANANLTAAREAYKAATLAKLDALELRKSLARNNSDGSTALANANREVALTSAKYKDALIAFLAAMGARPKVWLECWAYVTPPP